MQGHIAIDLKMIQQLPVSGIRIPVQQVSFAELRKFVKQPDIFSAGHACQKKVSVIFSGETKGSSVQIAGEIIGEVLGVQIVAKEQEQ